jgi:ubiquinone/menaquinone biosynthesis C-methylase UbiE
MIVKKNTAVPFSSAYKEVSATNILNRRSYFFMPLHLFSRKKQDPASVDIHQFSRPQPVETIINQRRYRPDVPYLLPKDLTERDRLNFQHYGLRQLLKGNYMAPITPEQTKDILDVGCGSGIWVQDMAREFPHAKVIGTDIEIPPMQTGALQSNTLFLINNVMQGLPFQDQAFDFVHQRLLAAAIPVANWKPLVQELVRVTRSGGYIELIEGADVFINEGPYSKQLMDWLRAAGRQMGFGSAPAKNLNVLLAQAGMIETQHFSVEAPLGQWAGHLGAIMCKNLHSAFSTLETACDRLGIVSPQQYRQVWEALPTEWQQLQTRFVFFIAYGKKPAMMH